MYTLRLQFKPWTDAKAIADGPNIRKICPGNGDENGITTKIQFNTRGRGRRLVPAPIHVWNPVNRTIGGTTDPGTSRDLRLSCPVRAGLYRA